MLPGINALGTPGEVVTRETLGVWAQSMAQIQGSIQDASGSAVPGAIVKATQTETGAVRATTSGADGTYVLTNLAIGPHRLEVSKPVSAPMFRPELCCWWRASPPWTYRSR